MYRTLISLGAVILLASLALTLGPPAHHAEAATGSISGVVYFDTDMNGIRNAGDSPAPGRTVELVSDIDEIRLATTKTASDGSYRFDNLDPAARYGVSVVRDGKTPCIGSGISFYSGADRTIDADIRVAPPGNRSVSGTLLSDLNENGEKDRGEPPLVGWQLRLTGLGDFECQIDVATGDQGEFEFAGLLAGTYNISPIAAPSSYPDKRVVWELTFATRPFDLPGAYPDMRFPDTSVDLESSKDVRGMELGLHVLSGTGSVTAWIFTDNDRDGTRDEDEKPFDCCSILFLRSSEAGLLFLETAEDRLGVGHYELTGLPPGDYTVALATWMPDPTGHVDADGRPVRVFTLREGEAAFADFGFGPQPTEPTEEPPPLATPVPATPLATPHLVVGMPNTGQPASGHDMWLPLAAVVTGVVAMGGAGLLMKLRLRR